MWCICTFALTSSLERRTTASSRLPKESDVKKGFNLFIWRSHIISEEKQQSPEYNWKPTLPLSILIKLPT